MNLILILCVKPNEALLNFAKSIEFCKVKIIVDDNSKNYNSRYVHQFSGKELEKRGYCNSNKGSHIKKNVIAWDKALFYLSTIEFDKCIIIEDDVFVPDANILEKIFDYEADLIVSRNEFRATDFKDWHWINVEKAISRPHYSSMVCAICVSKALINEIDVFVQKNKTLFHIEAMFNTIAMQSKLKVICPKELQGIYAMAHFDMTDFKLNPNMLFHPVKLTQEHERYRRMLKSPLKGICVEKTIDVLCPKPYQHQLIPYFLKNNS
jgi:hypothetical protein